MKSLGILIDKPGNSQKFQSLANALNQAKDINAVVFVCEQGPIPMKIDFPIMDLVHAYDFTGVLISTDIYTTMVMNNALRPKDRLFYVWDLENIYQPYSLSVLQTAFKNKLIARNQLRYNILKSTFHQPECIIEEFNYDNLKQLL